MLIKAKIFSKSKKQKIIKKSQNYFEIFVKEKPEQGQANKSARKILAQHLQVPENQVKLIKGFCNKNKIFKIK